MFRKSMTCKQISNTIRQLWNQHVLWTRFFLVSASFNLPDLTLVEQRLLQNPRDFAKALKPFYGARVVEEFKELFTSQLQIASHLVNATKEGNSAEADRQRRLWYANAEEIAGFLTSINPFWDEAAFRKLLFTHLQITENEAGFILAGQYKKGIKEYDAVEAEALEMADLMSYGIVRQFGII